MTKEQPTESPLHPPQHEQQELPIALVQGEAFMQMPKDLYIPPDALEIFLETFEGPLDLLLYLIKRQNLDILDIPIAEITRQYMEYVELMKAVRLELAAEYLVMAAMLAEIKSRMLLPKPQTLDEEDDPRADLIRRLQEYEQFKQAAEDVDNLPRTGRDIFIASARTPDLKRVKPLPEVDLKEVLLALKEVFNRAEMFSRHNIHKEALSVRERMANVLAVLDVETFTGFMQLFPIDEGRAGIVVTFLAIMELSKETLIEIIQTEAYGPIHVRAKGQPAVHPDGIHTPDKMAEDQKKKGEHHEHRHAKSQPESRDKKRDKARVKNKKTIIKSQE